MFESIQSHGAQLALNVFVTFQMSDFAEKPKSICLNVSLIFPNLTCWLFSFISYLLLFYNKT